jgi:hypothetical protein
VQPNYRGAWGWFPVDADRAVCLTCKEPLRKKHGMNQNRDDKTVMACFLADIGPYCIHDALRAWQDIEFLRRSGSSEYSARRWDLNRDFR